MESNPKTPTAIYYVHLGSRSLQTGWCTTPRPIYVCKQKFETASHVPCDWEALTAFRFRHLGQHFLKPSDFVQMAAECVSQRAAQNFDHGPSARVTLVPTLMYSVLVASLTHGALTLQGVRVLTFATMHASVTSPGDRWYSLNNKWLCEPPSESWEKQLCLRPEWNRSRRIVRELSRLISVTYL